MAFKRLTPTEVEESANLLLALRNKELILDDLPERLVPQTTADIQKIIDVTNSRIERPVHGWKIYCVYKPMQPVFYAPIYDVIEDGGTIPAELSGLRLIEPEIMFRINQDLPRREKKYSHEELSSYVTAVVGMEVVGGRFEALSLEDIYARSKSQKSNYGSLSDNIANSCIVIGDEIPNWRDVDFEDVRVTMTEDNLTLIDFIGGHPFDDPFLPALVGINRMRRAHDLAAGDMILTSSSTSFFPASAGTMVRTSYEGLGTASAIFAR